MRPLRGRFVDALFAPQADRAGALENANRGLGASGEHGVANLAHGVYGKPDLLPTEHAWALRSAPKQRRVALLLSARNPCDLGAVCHDISDEAKAILQHVADEIRNREAERGCMAADCVIEGLGNARSDHALLAVVSGQGQASSSTADRKLPYTNVYVRSQGKSGVRFAHDCRAACA